MSAAGAKSQLMGQPAIELVGPADVDRAHVALVVADAVDDAAVRVVRAIRRDGVARVVMVASRFEEDAVVAAVAAGVTSFLRRTEATSARLTDIIRQADQAGCHLPEGLLKKAAASAPADEPGPPVPATGSAGPEVPGDGYSSGVATLRLTARETEVLRLVADGFDTSEIAEQLAYSESTIKGVLAKIMTRLDARNRCHAVAIVVHEGLI